VAARAIVLKRSQGTCNTYLAVSQCLSSSAKNASQSSPSLFCCWWYWKLNLGPPISQASTTTWATPRALLFVVSLQLPLPWLTLDSWSSHLCLLSSFVPPCPVSASLFILEHGWSPSIQLYSTTPTSPECHLECPALGWEISGPQPFVKILWGRQWKLWEMKWVAQGPTAGQCYSYGPKLSSACLKAGMYTSGQLGLSLVFSTLYLRSVPHRMCFLTVFPFSCSCVSSSQTESHNGSWYRLSIWHSCCWDLGETWPRHTVMLHVQARNRSQLCVPCCADCNKAR
jgi:hypothetical protein